MRRTDKISLFPGLVEFCDYNSWGSFPQRLRHVINTPVHSLSAGWDRTACEGVSLKLPDSGLFSALWFADILSRTVKKTKESVSDILFRKGKILVPHHPDVFQLWTSLFYSTITAWPGLIIVAPPKHALSHMDSCVDGPDGQQLTLTLTLYSPTYRPEPEPEHRPHSTAASWMFSRWSNWLTCCYLCYSEE